jgi:hypothetical protein
MECVVAGDLCRDAATRSAIRNAYGPASAAQLAAGPRVALAASRKDRYAAPLREQIAVLAARSWKGVRPKVLERTALSLHMGNATIGGLMWYQVGYRERDIWARYTLAFALVIAWVFFPLMDSLGIVPAAEVMLKKELAVNAFFVEVWYSVYSTFLLAPMLAQSFLYLVIFFSLSGVSTNPVVFAALYGVVVLALLTFQSIGLFLSAAVKPDNLATCAMLLVTFCFLFTGFFIPLGQTAIPWAAYANPVLYILHLSEDAVFSIDAKRFDCGNDVDDEGTTFVRSCDDDGDGRIAVPEIYREYGLRAISASQAVGVLLAMLITTRVAALFILKRRMKRHFREMLAFEGAAAKEGGPPPALVEEETKEDGRSVMLEISRDYEEPDYEGYGP